MPFYAESKLVLFSTTLKDDDISGGLFEKPEGAESVEVILHFSRDCDEQEIEVSLTVTFRCGRDEILADAQVNLGFHTDERLEGLLGAAKDFMTIFASREHLNFVPVERNRRDLR